MAFILSILGLLVMVASNIFFYRLGYKQGTITQKAFDLSIRKAEPKIGTTARIDKRQENGPIYPPFYYLVATIYNEGELPATQLEGHCKLFSPINEIKQKDIPIQREFLGRPSPYKLEECRIDGPNFHVARKAGRDIRIYVDIEFSYFGIPDDKPQSYSAHYEYDSKSRQLIQVK